LKPPFCGAKLPRLLRRSHVVVGFATFVLALGAVSAAQAGTLTTPERTMLAEMNRVRGAHGLRPLSVDAELQRAARAHAVDMLHRDYFAHGPFLSRLLSYGAAGPLFGENLAWGRGIRARAQVMVRDWLASPSHRRNLLRGGFRRVGVGAPMGTFRGLTQVRIVTADFAGT
jgi:uncharacterized protein YkwD